MTSVKTRIIADRQQITRVDEEDKKDISDKEADKIFNILQNQIESYNAIILSDYGKGVLSPYFTQKIITNFKNMIIVDPKGNNYNKYSGATIIKPNYNEFKEAINQQELILNPNNLEHYAEELRTKYNLGGMVVTLGEHGVFIQNPEMEYKIIPTRAKSVFDVSGAGDTFTSLLAMSLCVNDDWFIAGDIANHGSGIVVGEVGTSYLKKEKLIENIEATV